MKQYIIIGLILLIIAFGLPIGIAVASDVSEADFYGLILITNNGTATADVSTVMTLSSPQLISASYVDSNFNGCAIRSSAGSDIPFMPGYDSNPWCIFVPSISANSSFYDTLYTSASANFGATKYYFPGSGGMTISDGDMELSDNGSAVYSGYVNTSVNDTFVHKPAAFKIYTISGNITASIISPTNTSPTGYSDPDSQWTNETNAYDDNTGSFASSTTPSMAWGSYIILTFSSTDISAVGYYAWIDNKEANDLIDIDVYDSAWTDVYSGAYTDSTWEDKTAIYQSATQLRVRFYNNDGAGREARLYEVRINEEVPILSVTSAQSSDAYKIEGIMDSANLTLSIDDSIEDTIALSGNSTPDNSHNWIIGSDTASPYIEYFELSVGGVQKCYIEWEYASTFSDQSGNNNDATPTFRTTSSDADVSANLTSFAPLSPARAPATTITSPEDFYTANITATGNFSTSNITVSDVPGYGVVTDITEDSGLPGFWLWGILSGCAIATCGIGLSYARRRFGISGGYVLVIIFGVVLIFGFLITTGPFDWWMLWLYIIIALGIAVASRHIDLGGNTSQHSWIGFLASAWIGLTLINRIMEGSFITSAETAFLNDVAFTQAFSVFGMFTLPIINFSFFTEGIPALLRWDYSFFGGQAQIIQYMLYSFTAVVSFIIFVIALGLIYNFFSRIR